ncbi:MAG TPA: RNA-binding protein [Ignavibacteriales bacterium]|nr:RNA-binding protein [Ignavibacteriales bacterium]HOL81208.1 RNA-binding protein [Ignavibacteriales bacterium]HOM65311.1 RNA-binding protein [Ignavibacteriales bacterium]HPD68101.1 RNA-binding protein [Ignavibacteriales bacterium]HPP33436.1 RNA-binding protein [Ignavibacteriales bacterium]
MNLFVGNLDFKVKSEELAGLFSQFGEVKSARVITDKETGRSRGFGFVEMENETEAKAAIEKLNGTEFKNRSISVNEARPKENAVRR